MKAITVHKYGGPEVLVSREVKKPTPKAGEILVRVEASTVTAGTVLLRKGAHPDIPLFTPLIRLMTGILHPRNPVPGIEFSGVVTELGEGVTAYKLGDRVFGTTTGCKQGSYAEYVCVPVMWKQGVLLALPEALSFDEGAALPVGAMTAYDLTKHLDFNDATSVLVYGASGSVGTYMLQLAKSRGAKVMAVCSTGNHDFVRDLGADEVLDYHKDTYSNWETTYDIILDAVGKMKKKDRKRMLKPTGQYISISKPTSERLDDLQSMLDLVVERRIKIAIDRCYTINEIQAAHAYAETGRKRGNLVVKIGGEFQ